MVRRELLQATANVDRVSKEIIAFAHRSDVSVDPQYGTWNRLNVVPPVAPPPQFLLPAVSGSGSIPRRPDSRREPAPRLIGVGTRLVELGRLTLRGRRLPW